MKEDRKDNSNKKEEQLPTASRLTPDEEAMFAAAPPKVKGYHIINTLGEGGFGIVYLAEQEKPVRRRVALKVIKPGMDSKRVIARFEAEEQALALLDHPNVARVYEAGMTEAGQPYFAMEYVKGVPITEYCDRNKLGVEDRLKVFVDVCDAIGHAHQKGIIHRDIKPSNILVYTEGENVVPKVIDFGVAKAISQPLTEQTLFTEQGQLIGTPEYMSPEQAEMAAQDIDTRTDIYSLGMLLYELLTGALPFDPKTLREAGFAEIQRIIREQDPPRPSARLSSLGEEAKEVAQSRRTKVAVLAKKLQKELEWIPLKAMRKERTHRYRSASEFADDIQNYLNGAPLIAGPESAVYRAKKFVRRNRALVSGVAAVLVVLVAGIVVSTIFAIGQARARVEAERQAKISRAVINFFQYNVSGMAEGKHSVEEVLNAASDRIEGEFGYAPLVEASIRETLGASYDSIGKHKLAEPHLQRVLEIRRAQLGEEHLETMYTMNNLAVRYSRQGRHEEAEALYVKVVEIARRELGEEHFLPYFFMANLADNYSDQGRYEEAEALYVKVLKFLHRMSEDDEEEDELELGWMAGLAEVYSHQGRYEEAEALFIKAVEGQRRELGEEHKQTLESMNKLIELYEAWGKPEQAEEWRAKLQTQKTKGR